MKHRGSWEQRRRNQCRHGQRAPRRHRRANRRESDQLQAQKYSLHLRNLPPKVSNKDIELWLCRAAQLCLKCTDGDPRLYHPIKKVTEMYSKTQNSSSFHLKLRDVCTKQAIIQHVKDEDLRARLEDFYGDQSLVIEVTASPTAS